jgi:hypothetical protein
MWQWMLAIILRVLFESTKQSFHFFLALWLFVFVFGFSRSSGL